MSKSAELESVLLDLAEIKDLLDNHAKREATKRLLNNELTRLEKLKNTLENRSNSQASVTNPTITQLNTVTNFAWDQTDKFVKVYLSLDDIKDTIDESMVELTFPDETSIRVIFGRNKFILTKLQEKINTKESYFKLTKSKLILYLRKRKDENWSNIQFSKPKTVFDEKEEMDPGADPSATLMNLMKKMYNEGDDDMKRTIAKSWYEAQQKKDTQVDLSGDF